MKIYLEIDNAITELEVMQEKAITICEDLQQGFFCEDELDINFMHCYYGAASIKNDIVFDYLYQMGKKIEELEIKMGLYSPEKSGVVK